MPTFDHDKAAEANSELIRTLATTQQSTLPVYPLARSSSQVPKANKMNQYTDAPPPYERLNESSSQTPGALTDPYEGENLLDWYPFDVILWGTLLITKSLTSQLQT